MNPEEVIQTIDTAVFAKTGKHLKPVEIIVLRGAWQARTYEQIAETCQYSLNYIKQVSAPRLWLSLSEVLGEDVSKTNFRFVIERKWENVLKSTKSKSETVETNPNSYQDWGEAPDVTNFYGRNQELAKLKQWIVGHRCRLVTIAGIAGIGKTALSVRCAKEIQQEFEFVIWRDLRNAPTAEELLTDIAQSLNRIPQSDLLSSESDIDRPENIDRQISTLIGYLRKHRCLIVLDTATAIWQSGHFAGHYREEYQSYGKLIKRLAQEPHESCVVLISREKPREIAFIEGETLPVRSLTLKGLRSGADKIFKEKQLLDVDRWEELIQLYQGNPLALKIVATTIQELFGGSVAVFLKQNTIVFGDLNDILDEQFECLSELEIEILYWLAIASQPMTLSQLREDTLSPMTQSDLIEALESLLRRSLVARTTGERETLFALQQPVVTQYIIDRAIEQICEEIQEVAKSKKLEKLELLRSHALITKSEPNEEVRAMQDRLILAPIADKLRRIYRDESLLEDKLTTILGELQGKKSLVIGYAKENIEHLQAKLELANSSQSLSC
jgi:hypothetical protein